MANPSDNLQQRLGETERSLVDERAERARAQRRASELQDSVQVWRNRAEDRVGRIAQLELERDQLRTAGGWLRSKAARWRSKSKTARVATTEPVSGFPSPSRLPPMIPGVLIASNATGSVASLVAEGNERRLDSGPWDEVDVVVADPSSMSADEHSFLVEWLALTVRPPTIVVTAERDTWDDADLLLRPPGSDTDGVFIPEPIDLTKGDFTRQPAAVLETMSWGSEVDLALDEGGFPIGVIGTLGKGTSQTLTQIAASGVPVGPTVDAVRAAGAGQLARRWAWAERDPAFLLSGLLNRVEVPHFSPLPCVAGVLVSNRPADLLKAIAGFANQTYSRKKLVVGCHGIDVGPAERLLEERHPDLPSRVIHFPRNSSLGRCLNAAVEAANAPILAKIDDDDHYGPAYLVDAVNAMRYSGAGVIGKAAQFTYVQSVDRTVLRRTGSEETYVEGTLTGATLVFRRSVWESVGFPDRPRRVDVYFLDGVRAAGHSVYANSRWEFVYRRNADGHTWQADDAVFLSGAEPAWDGWDPRLAEL